MSHNQTQFVDLENARVEEQRQEMQRIIEAGHCPFCPENVHLYHKQPNLKDGRFWFVTKNQWPYENVKLQLLAIYKSHAENLQELDPDAGEELLRFFAEIEKEMGVPGGAFAMRFGDTTHSAGSVKHIHAQFIWPDIEKPGFKSVRFKIGK
jgi:diadenosine tetraphosphate (Ap4A) HIT family hydrolase